jgi:hypothetical protein
MNLQEGIEKLKELLFKNEAPVSTELKFKEELLNDGTTMIQYDADELAVGVVVNLLDTTGQILPLPVGDYETQKGDMFTVVNDQGAIDNVVLVPENSEEEDGATVNPTENTAPVAQSSGPAPAPTPKRVIKSQVEEHVFSLDVTEVNKMINEAIENFKKENEVELAKIDEKFTAVSKENESLKVELAKEKDLNKEMFAIVKEIAEAPASAPTETKEKFSVAKQKELFRASMAEMEIKMSNDNL